jgi:hypothetical protein
MRLANGFNRHSADCVLAVLSLGRIGRLGMVGAGMKITDELAQTLVDHFAEIAEGRVDERTRDASYEDGYAEGRQDAANAIRAELTDIGLSFPFWTTDLPAALAVEQEPVAWRWRYDTKTSWTLRHGEPDPFVDRIIEPLYADPVAAPVQVKADEQPTLDFYEAVGDAAAECGLDITGYQLSYIASQLRALDGDK